MSETESSLLTESVDDTESELGGCANACRARCRQIANRSSVMLSALPTPSIQTIPRTKGDKNDRQGHWRLGAVRNNNAHPVPLGGRPCFHSSRVRRSLYLVLHFGMMSFTQIAVSSAMCCG